MDADMQERIANFEKESAVNKIVRGECTDADRAKLGEGYDKVCQSCVFLEPTEKNLMKEGTPEEKAAFADKSKSLWDRLHPWLLRKSIASPFIYDLRRGNIPATIYYVNTGANDFNQVDPESEFTPSIMIALHFKDCNPNNCEQKFKKEDCIRKANDYIYVYKKLLENHPDGLNSAMIDAYEKKHPEDKVRETLNQIAEYAKQPETERFRDKPKQEPVQGKLGFWSRLLGRGAKR